MNGRHYAMKAAGINKPQGKAYAEAFREWKTSVQVSARAKTPEITMTPPSCARNIAPSPTRLSPCLTSNRSFFRDGHVRFSPSGVRAKMSELEDGLKAGQGQGQRQTPVVASRRRRAVGRPPSSDWRQRSRRTPPRWRSWSAGTPEPAEIFRTASPPPSVLVHAAHGGGA